jgi:hypothetical protein
LFDKGIKIVICAFNEQMKEYSENIDQLKLEIKKLKEENYMYKNKLSILQKKLNTLSKTVCVLDMETEEAKNQFEKKITDSRMVMATLNKDYSYINNNKKRKKNSSVNNKLTLYKNFLSQNRNYNICTNQYNSNNTNPKTYGNNQLNLKHIIDTPKNTTYNKVLENINYFKKKNNVINEQSSTNNSYLMDDTSKDINLCEDSRTDRNVKKNKVFSEKRFDNNKKYIKNYNIKNNKVKEIINNNSLSGELNDINSPETKINERNDDDLFLKCDDDNMCSKSSEDEIFFKDMKISGDNNSKLYKKLNNFLEECKAKLNAIDYENVIELLKSFEIDSNIDVRKKVKKIINNNQKLCKLFDNIFES